MPHRSQERILSDERLEDRPGIVDRSIVDDYNLISSRGMPKSGGCFFHEQGQIFSFILRWNENTHEDS